MSYAGQTILLASKHKKEQAIAPPFKQILQCELWVPNDFDTDQFGTFTGEIVRTGNQYEALILKAKKAAEMYGYKHVIASEGSFVPHPSLYFVPAAVEMLVFLDVEADLTIVESLVSQETNYAHCDLDQFKLPDEFLKSVGFPEHALIGRQIDTGEIIAKAIQTEEQLRQAITVGLRKGGKVRLETDMRAHLNPTRMKILGNLAKKLVQRIETQCPGCATAGFGKITYEGNLCCEACNTPTELYQHKILNCLKCDFQRRVGREDGLLQASQQYCPYCNP